jgi:hypothetical protein
VPTRNLFSRTGKLSVFSLNQTKITEAFLSHLDYS